MIKFLIKLMGENLMTNINIEKEAGIIAKKLDSFKPHERISVLEHNVEDLVNRFRDSLNEEIINELNLSLRKKEPVVCEKAHGLYRYEGKKKTFF